ncbi:izumo sperm-egg fusion protein 4 isoform X7 [Callorhinus ursinus]|uniref:izumo sperm-egg fusion protein 4 isoform X7 n=1 Tax=Callorhinus ursinus TaxID=34884 RepID=UPI003CD04DAC
MPCTRKWISCTRARCISPGISPMSCEPSFGSRCTSSRMPSSKAASTVSVTVASSGTRPSPAPTAPTRTSSALATTASLRHSGRQPYRASSGTCELGQLGSGRAPRPPALPAPESNAAVVVEISGTNRTRTQGKPPPHPRPVLSKALARLSGREVGMNWEGLERADTAGRDLCTRDKPDVTSQPQPSHHFMNKHQLLLPWAHRTTPAFLISPSFTCLEPPHLANLTLENASECLTQH